MPRLFNRAADAQPIDWRADKKLLAATDRLAEIERLLNEKRDLIRNSHAPRLIDLAAVVERAELEVLAGKGTESALAAAQQAHLDARMAEARDKIAIEDLEDERRKLEPKVPGLRVAAKKVALKSIRAKYRAVLLRMQKALTDAVDADAELFALSKDADQQFAGTPNSPGSDEDGFPKGARMHAISKVYFSLNTGGYSHSRTIEGNTVAFLNDIEKALAALDADEAKDAGANGSTAGPAAAPDQSGLV